MIPRSAISVLCDDIRAELGQKISLMGLYGPEIIIYAMPPIVLPKICGVVWLTSDIRDQIDQFTIRVTAPIPNDTDTKDNNREVFRQNVDVSHMQSVTEGATKRTYVSTLGISPFVAGSAGFIEIWVDTPNKKPIRAGRFIMSFSLPSINTESVSPIFNK
jgi:hypothetical protein